MNKNNQLSVYQVKVWYNNDPKNPLSPDECWHANVQLAVAVDPKAVGRSKKAVKVKQVYGRVSPLQAIAIQKAKRYVESNDFAQRYPWINLPDITGFESYEGLVGPLVN
jgi:hypothetical protein